MLRAHNAVPLLPREAPVGFDPPALCFAGGFDQTRGGLSNDRV